MQKVMARAQGDHGAVSITIRTSGGQHVSFLDALDKARGIAHDQLGHTMSRLEKQAVKFDTFVDNRVSCSQRITVNGAKITVTASARYRVKPFLLYMVLSALTSDFKDLVLAATGSSEQEVKRDVMALLKDSLPEGMADLMDRLGDDEDALESLLSGDRGMPNGHGRMPFPVPSHANGHDDGTGLGQYL